MIASLFAALLAVSPAPVLNGCSLQQPAACSDVRQLAADPQFQAALKRFVGNRSTRYLDERGHAYDEALLLLQGPAEPAHAVGGRTLFAACREHSTCEEKAAVLLGADGAFGAVGVLHTECARIIHRVDCFEHFTLSVFTLDEADQASLDILSRWAKDEVAANIASPGAPATFLDGVEQVAAAKPGRVPVVLAAAADPALAMVSAAPAAAPQAVTPAPETAAAAPAPADPKPRTSKSRSKEWKWRWTPYS